MGRKTTCSRCSNEKEPSQQSSGYCKKCALARRKENTTAKRLAQGLSPWGSGIRKPTCCKCGEIKERLQSGYCNSCKNEQERARMLRTGKTKKHRTGRGWRRAGSLGRYGITKKYGGQWWSRRLVGDGG